MTPLETKRAVMRHPAFRSLTKVVDRGHTTFTVRLFFMGEPVKNSRTFTVNDATRSGAFRKAALRLVTQRITQ